MASDDPRAQGQGLSLWLRSSFRRELYRGHTYASMRGPMERRKEEEEAPNADTANCLNCGHMSKTNSAMRSGNIGNCNVTRSTTSERQHTVFKPHQHTSSLLTMTDVPCVLLLTGQRVTPRALPQPQSPCQRPQRHGSQRHFWIRQRILHVSALLRLIFWTFKIFLET